MTLADLAGVAGIVIVFLLIAGTALGLIDWRD